MDLVSLHFDYCMFQSEDYLPQKHVKVQNSALFEISKSYFNTVILPKSIKVRFTLISEKEA
ncbi:Protein CBG27757 [Caenorhabditis briggsae]|uniref:Protein CBG27757 n=1 Tax=Caenorhabditis briggsae TaxID=6238 RepID=B6IFY1_CAEBR|nr:Protein CBG27757 [Caenorhabditis briggsae]CAR98811.1 Protein CBG27757 [Caenorhabditis briggsae]